MSLKRLSAILVCTILVVVLLASCTTTPTPAPSPATTSAPKSTAPASPAPTSSPAKTSPAAVSAADFYKGKTLTVISSANPGQPSDIYTRLAATYLQEKMGISGVKIVFDSAAAGLVANNKFYKNVEADGLTIIAEPMSSTFLDWVMDMKGVEYNPSKFQYIGGNKVGEICIATAPDSPYKRSDIKGAIAALKAAKGLKFGSGSIGASTTIVPLVFIDALGLDCRALMGYRGGDKILGLQRKEIDLEGRPIDSLVRLEREGSEKMLILLSMQKDKNFPDVPALGEVVELSDNHKKLFQQANIPDPKMYAAPPATPPDRVKFLREGFAAVMADKALQGTIAQIQGIWLGWESGETIQKFAESFDKPGFVSWYGKLVDKYVVK